MKKIILICFIALTTSFNCFAQDRDESLARSFINCALVSQYWVEYLTATDPTNPEGVSDIRQSIDLFYIAAVLKSDETFLKEQKPLAVERIKARIKQQRETNQPIMSDSAKECNSLLRTDVAPLLKK